MKRISVLWGMGSGNVRRIFRSLLRVYLEIVLSKGPETIWERKGKNVPYAGIFCPMVRVFNWRIMRRVHLVNRAIVSKQITMNHWFVWRSYMYVCRGIYQLIFLTPSFDRRIRYLRTCEQSYLRQLTLCLINSLKALPPNFEPKWRTFTRK